MLPGSNTNASRLWKYCRKTHKSSNSSPISSPLRYVVNELVETERHYVSDLRFVVEVSIVFYCILFFYVGPCASAGHVPTLPRVRSRVLVSVGSGLASGRGWVGMWPATRLDPSQDSELKMKCSRFWRLRTRNLVANLQVLVAI